MRELKKFIEKNRKIYLWAVVFTALCFGFMLTHYMVNIDEETWALRDTSSNIWLLQGRYAIRLFDLLFTQKGRFIPFLWDVLSILLWNFAGLLFAYVFWDFEKKDSALLRFITLSYFCTVPLCVGEAFAFTMMVLPEALGMVFAALAFVMTVKPFWKKKVWNILAIMVCMVLSLGMYQAIVCVYVTAIVGYCLFQTMFDRKFAGVLLQGMFYSIVPMIIYEIINISVGRIIGTANYLSDSYIGWNCEEGIPYALFMALANVVRVTFGITIQDVTIYGANALRIVIVLFVIAGVTILVTKKGLQKKLLLLLFGVGTVMAPFTLYLVLGTYKTHGRMMIGLALAGMIELLVVFLVFQKKWAEKTALILSAVVLLMNASNMNRIYYNSYLVYQYDKTTAQQIIYDVERLDYDYHEKPVVFVGYRPMDDIGIEKSGSLGGSFFEWDGGNEIRLIDFMKMEGHTLVTPTVGQMEEALAVSQSEQMNPWPQENSMIETEDIIVVYLSEPTDKWYVTNLGRPAEKP